MKAPKPKKPANRRVRLLRSKLEALAAVGIGGEKVNAQKKLDKLLARYDWKAPDVEIKDMFTGTFIASAVSRYIVSFKKDEQDIAAAVKWAIEQACGLRGSFRDDALWIEADISSLAQLCVIALRIREGSKALWERFARVPGVCPGDRSLFLRGIYDGMLSDERAIGERLPERRIEPARKARARKTALATAPGLGIHPYTVALDLGRQLRFEAPITDIIGSLETAVGQRKDLPEHASC